MTDALARLPLFFYGTLRDETMLDEVLGAGATARLTLSPAQAPDKRVERVRGEGFPMLFDAPGESAEGVVVDDLTPIDRRRLTFFEDGDYTLSPIDVMVAGARRSAAVFLPTERLIGDGSRWDIDAWRRDERPLLIECAREQMSYFDRLDRAAVEPLWPDIKSRAERRLGLTPTIRSAFARSDVEETAREEAYRRYFGVDERYVRYRRYDGGQSEEVRRGVFLSDPAVTILPYDPDDDTLVLIEQWRVGPWALGDANPWTIEVVAGRIEDGQTPEETARREAIEEASVAIHAIESVAAYYSTPGIAQEYLYSFVGQANLAEAGGVHGLPEEGENIRVLKLPFWGAMSALHRGDVNSGPAVMSLLWLARNRDRLRLAWRSSR